MNRKSQSSKIFTIIKHEYILKVKSKGFIISTLLGPVIMLVFFGIIALIAFMSQNSTEKKLAVIDKSSNIGRQLVQKEPKRYFLTEMSEDSIKHKVLSEEMDGYLLVPADVLKTNTVLVFTGGGGGIGYITALTSSLTDIVRTQRLRDAGVSDEIIAGSEKSINIENNKVTKKGTEKDYTEVFAILGYVMGFGIYILMFAYGSMVMRGVIEEKANRIVEVIASSAKPFEIMFGKVVGIGCVGLTQLLFWIGLSSALLGSSGAIISKFTGPQQAMQNTALQSMQGMQGMNSMPAGLPAGFEIPHISPWLGVGFLFFFLAGYFIYSTLFAAIGSAVDQESDAQQLQMPVTLPIVIPMLFIPYLMSNPDGMLSVVLSLVPFFSPILMMVRVASTNVPFWQIAASVVLCLLTFWGCLAMASKIYRIGILMYGKKPTLKDIYKWLRTA